MSKPHMPDPISEQDLHAFVDQALDAERRREVQAYVDRHPEAAARLVQITNQRQALRSALAPIADEPIPERLRLHHIQARLDAERNSRQASPWGWRMAAAVLVALGTGGLGGWQLRGDHAAPDSGIVALAGEARSSFTAYALDGEVTTDRQALVSLVSTKLRRPIEIPNLDGAGYRYAGGRLVATAHGPAGLFFYDRTDGTRIAMMVRPMAHEREAPMMEQSAGPVGGFTWAAGGLGVSVVGTEQPTSLHPLANEVRRQLREALPQV